MEGIKLIFGIMVFICLFVPFLGLEALVFLFGGWTMGYERPSPVYWLMDVCGLN